MLIRGAQVLDVRSGDYLEVDVQCVDGVVTAVGAEADGQGREAVIDARGLFLLPGLIDAHVHLTSVEFDLGRNDHTSPSLVTALAAQEMHAMLRRGFTTVRDMGGADHGLAQAQREGLFPGPRIAFAGRALSQTGGHGDFRLPGDDDLVTCRHGVGRIVDGVDQVRQAARDEIRKGATHIKIMASGGVASPTDRIDSTQFSVEEIAAAVEEADAANIYVAAHAYTGRAINRCLEQGVRTIEHGNLLDERSIELLLARDAYLVPNVAVYHVLTREGREHGMDAAGARKAHEVLDGGLRSLEAAYRAGVQIAFGSDLLGPMRQHQSQEFLLRSEVQPNLAIVRSATMTGARLLRQEGRLGEIIVGAEADMILLREDPLSDIQVLAQPEKYLHSVIQRGRKVC